MNAEQLRQEVIRPTLKRMGLWSQAAENLLMGTAAQESHLGEYIVQMGNGPARGIFQMEPATQTDIYDNYLSYRSNLLQKTEQLLAPIPDRATQLATNTAYACAMARVHYYRAPEALPDADDIQGLAAYWKKYYNTPLGAGTEEEFVHNYHRFVS